MYKQGERDPEILADDGLQYSTDFVEEIYKIVTKLFLGKVDFLADNFV